MPIVKKIAASHMRDVIETAVPVHSPRALKIAIEEQTTTSEWSHQKYQIVLIRGRKRLVYCHGVSIPMPLVIDLMGMLKVSASNIIYPEFDDLESIGIMTNDESDPD